MAEPSQEELEKPVKNYQLLAVVKEVKELKESFNEKLNIIITQTSDTVKQTELKESLKCLESDLREHVAAEVKTINMKYGPMKREIVWVIRTVVLAIIGIILDIAARFLIK